MHNKLVDKILQCPMHVVVTLRTKTEYVIEDGANGKKTPRKIGMAPIFREGIEFEFTIFLELDQSHAAAASKDRTGLFDGQYFVISTDTGAQIYSWLAGAKPQMTAPIASSDIPDSDEDTPLSEKVDQVMRHYCAELSREEKEVVSQRLREITGGTANYRSITDQTILKAIYNEFSRREP